MGRAQRGSGIGTQRRGGRLGLTTLLAALALTMASLGGCRRAAFALLPGAPMGPQRNADPFAPLGPPAESRAPEGKSPTLSTAAGKVDVGVSAAAVVANFLGGTRMFFGLYGDFEETAVVAPDRDPARKRAASPPDDAPAVPPAAPPAAGEPPR